MGSSDIFEILFKIVLVILLSCLLGIEREIRHKAADIRTHILVGVGSSLVVMTSLFIFEEFNGITFIDPTRMITGIVTGIGFLCAGTIIRAGANVYGLTTAATLWIVSCIGISVGAGHYEAAIIVTLVVFFVLVFMRSFEKKIGKRFKSKWKEE